MKENHKQNKKSKTITHKQLKRKIDSIKEQNVLLEQKILNLKNKTKLLKTLIQILKTQKQQADKDHDAKIKTHKCNQP